jgi:DNA-binding transcriptional regulator GbsR (MarR family)
MFRIWYKSFCRSPDGAFARKRERTKRRDMEIEQRRFEEKHFIEDVGLLFEESGHPRMAGRILGCLLISDEPHLSTTEIADILQASKGSLSTMTRFLLQMGMIERVGMPGKRVDYFRIKTGAWPVLVRHAVYELSALRKLADRGLDLMRAHGEGKDSDKMRHLEEARDLFAFVEREYPLLIERWEKGYKSAPERKSAHPKKDGTAPGRGR